MSAWHTGVNERRASSALGAADVACVAEHVLLVERRSGAESTVSASTLEGRSLWSVGFPARVPAVVPRSGEVIVAAGDVLVRLGRDGAELARSPRGAPFDSLQVAGDRALAATRTDVRTLDLGVAFGTELARRPLEPGEAAYLGPSRVVLVGRERVEALRPDDLAPLWSSRPGPKRTDGVALDERGIVLAAATFELDANTGERLWLRPADEGRVSQVLLDGSSAVVTSPDRPNLRVIDRGSGATRWTRDRRGLAAVAVAAGLVHVASVSDRTVTIEALRLDDAVRLLHHDVALFGREAVGQVWLHVTLEALVVAVRRGARLETVTLTPA